MAATSRFCDFNKYGYCKFGDRCTMLHNRDICDKTECPVIECDLRHPKPCKYFKTYRRCKFNTYCKYSHEEFNNENKNDKIKIETLEKSVEHLESCLKKCLGKIEYLENKMEKNEHDTNELNKKFFEAQTETFSNLETSINEKVMEKLDQFQEQFEKTSETVDFLKDTMDYCNEKFVEKFDMQLYPKMFCEKCKKKLRLAHFGQLDKHMENVHRIFKCLLCEFISESERGRTIHYSKIHSKQL